MTSQGERVRLMQSKIPTSPSFVDKESSFFRKWDRLPSPDEVQARAKETHSIEAPYARPPSVIFEEMGLYVKWGSSVQLSEARCLYAIRQLPGDDLPVPEVYGWLTEGDLKYIYMEYVNGLSLEKAWPMMGDEDKSGICCEIRRSLHALRQVEQDPDDSFVGNITKGPLYDRAFHVNYMHEAGPFATVRDFHDWFTFLYRRPMPDPYSVPVEPFRHDLPDDCAIKFTHGDLHRSNIIITSTPPYRLLAIVDWEQSGWLPEYWEARKAQYTADRAEPWSTTYLPMILDQFASTWETWDYYTSAMGC